MNSLSIKRIVATLSIMTACALPAYSQAPPAGTQVVNQARVLYTDETGQDRTATTNEVVLIVSEVYSATIEADQTRQVSAGRAARFVHTLTNTGNTVDEFCVSAVNAAGDDGDFERIEIWGDLNNNGLAEDGEPLLYSSATPGQVGQFSVNAGQSEDLIILGHTAAGLAVDNTYDLILSASGTGEGATCNAYLPLDIGADADSSDGTNQDSAVISVDAVLDLRKSSAYTIGNVGTLADDTITYTVTLTNNSDIPTGMIEFRDTLPEGVTFQSYGTLVGAWTLPATTDPNEVTASLNLILPNDFAVMEFTVAVDADLGEDGGSRTLENTAHVEADIDGVAGLEPEIASNTVIDEVPQIFGVTLSDTGMNVGLGVNNGGDDDGSVNDEQFVDRVPTQGRALFALTVTNTGNGVDTFNLSELGGRISVNEGLFWLQSDGVTPLLDTTSDGISDTGPLDPGQSLSVYVEMSVGPVALSSKAQQNVQAVSTGQTNPNISAATDPSTLAIGSSQAEAVDIANAGSVSGFNDGAVIDAHAVGGGAITTLTTPAGGTVTFPLFIANEGTARQSFRIFASQSASTLETDIPAGWNVVFESVSGVPISQTPSLAGGEVFEFVAKIVSPEGQLTGSVHDFYFHTAGQFGGARDVKHDAVEIVAASALTFAPDGQAQIIACGVRDYIHTLTNRGGADLSVKISIISQSDMRSELWMVSGFTGNVPNYQLSSDFNAGDTFGRVGLAGGMSSGAVVSDGAGGFALTLAPRTETYIKARVQADCDMSPGTVDLLTIRAETLNGDHTLQLIDRTTLSTTQVEVVKHGAADRDCNLQADGNFGTFHIQAGPGECVLWQIEVTNIGVETVCDMHARDSAPSFTSIFSAPNILTEPSPGTGSCAMTGDDWVCSLGNTADPHNSGTPSNYCLASGETASVGFAVQVD